MASFDVAYRITERNEGGYANNPKDRGGETYKGVARRFHPNPDIWNYVDQIKSQVPQGPGYVSRLNKQLSQCQPLQVGIYRFYKYEFWDKNNLSLVSDQNVANRIYDMTVNAGGNAIKLVRRVIGTREGTTLGPEHVRVINTIEGGQLVGRLKDAMANYYKAIVDKNPSQGVFLVGWLSRLVDKGVGEVKRFMGVGQPSIPTPEVKPRDISLIEYIEMAVTDLSKK